MKRFGRIIIAGILSVLICASLAAAHCEIPCGIYDDKLRTALIAEHATTIEKSMRQIANLSNTKPVNHNQLVRWISNKEKHADEIQEIVSQYFMTQRIKPGQVKYAEKLELLHKMLIAAMKCKQTAEPAHVETLRGHLRNFEKVYFSH